MTRELSLSVKIFLKKIASHINLFFQFIGIKIALLNAIKIHDNIMIKIKQYTNKDKNSKCYKQMNDGLN